MTSPAHLQTMRAITGTHEAPGSADNPTIIGWARAIGEGFPEMAPYCASYTHDEIAWCGLTVGYCMAANGIRPPFDPHYAEKSFLWAASWKNFGEAVQGPPQPGDVLVKDHHVTLYERTEGDHYICRGGNQSDQVKESSFPASVFYAVRRPSSVATQMPSTAPHRFMGITATWFGGPSDHQAGTQTAYGDVASGWWDRLGVALPCRFKGTRPQVRVFCGSESVVCPVIDVGPHFTTDDYWTRGNRPQAEGPGHSNPAGIDLTPATVRALGLDPRTGRWLIDWEFVGADAPITTPAPTPAPAPSSPLSGDLLLLILLLILKGRLMSDTKINLPATQGNDPIKGLFDQLGKKIAQDIASHPDVLLSLLTGGKIVSPATPAPEPAPPPPPPPAPPAPQPGPFKQIFDKLGGGAGTSGWIGVLTGVAQVGLWIAGMVGAPGATAAGTAMSALAGAGTAGGVLGFLSKIAGALKVVKP